MSSKLEIESIILASGVQSRYGLKSSKLMARVEGKPAFSYTMRSILEVIPEELVTIISSHLFEDFNDYVSHHHQKARLLFNLHPGNGSAQTLKLSVPWKTREVFVSEGNIYYESYLIPQMYDTLLKNPNLMSVLSITPQLNVAPTHRKVVKGKLLDLSGSNELPGEKVFRNVGAYTFRSGFEQELTNAFKDIIEVLHSLSLTEHSVVALEYYSRYLHMATPEDIIFWINTFKQNTKGEL